MISYKLYVRNLTKGNEFYITLPTQNICLDADCEYMILDDDDLGVPEYSNLYNLNAVLAEWNEKNISNTDIEVLKQVLTFDEICERIENETYLIVHPECVWTKYPDTTDVAAWMVFEGLFSLPFVYKDEMEHYIDWETVWREAEFNGWHYVYVGNKGYLVYLSQ